MVALAKQDIQTREVLDWEGVHLLHFMGSSCSQKSRIFLNLKGIDWTSHHVDLTQRENYTDWFMGINPRGLVPVLVHNGQVIIESNDILEHLEAEFPEPELIPAGRGSEMHALLEEEDALHLDLRALSMRFMFGDAAQRSEDQLAAYRDKGSGTVNGELDPHKDVELQFFEQMLENGGITDEQVKQAVQSFHQAFSGIDAKLSENPYILGEPLSLIDIAWYIYSNRLLAAGYPIHEQHPAVGAWYNGLHQRPEFSKEVQAPPPMVERVQALHRQQAAEGKTLALVGGLT